MRAIHIIIIIFYIHEGVNPYKAGKFRAEESSGEKPSQQTDSRYDIFEGENGDGRTTDKYVRDGILAVYHSYQ